MEWSQIAAGNATKALLRQAMDGSKPILPITQGQAPSSDMIIVVDTVLLTYLEFLKIFTGSVQKIITLSNSSVDVVLVRRRDLVIHIAVSIHFLFSRIQPFLTYRNVSSNNYIKR